MQTVDDDIEDVIEVEGDGPAKKREGTALSREPGKSLLPFARVQRIVKADKELPVIAKEATFLISVATEEFIKSLCQAAHHVAQGEKRSTVQNRDIVNVAQRFDEFLFLDEIMLWMAAENAGPLKKSKAAQLEFKSAQIQEQTDDQDIVMNTDGTMDAEVDDDDT